MTAWVWLSNHVDGQNAFIHVLNHFKIVSVEADHLVYRICAGGYIFRKRAAESGEASSLSCFGWYLDMEKGPEFHYGGHDVFDDNPELSLYSRSKIRSRQIQLGQPKPSK